MSAWESAANGVNPKTNTERQKYRNHWKNYTTVTGINPFLDKSVPPDKREIIAGVFAAWARTGSYGRGNQIKFQASRMLSELAGQHSQLYQAD